MTICNYLVRVRSKCKCEIFDFAAKFSQKNVNILAKQHSVIRILRQNKSKLYIVNPLGL